MKKLLAMVLALVMTLSLAVSANAAFKDADKVSETYEEAVAVLNGMGVFKGYEDGSFQPQGNITRAEVAAIVYRVYTADVKDAKASMYATYNKFSDMAGAGWAQGYIGYCANAALVKGYPNGTFQPSGKVTGYEVLTMILRAIGYDKNNEFSGADWALHVAQTAQQAGVLDNVKGVDLNAPATRELVAELLFRAIAVAPMVTYTAAFGYQTVSFDTKKDNKFFKDNETLGHKNFLLDSDVDADAWGRPTTVWFEDADKDLKHDDSETVYATITATPDASFNVATTECDICAALGVKKSADVVEIYTNGVKKGTDTLTATETKAKLGAQGQQIEFYENKDGDYRMVVIDTYLAYVNEVVEKKVDSKDHTTRDAYLALDVYKTDDGKATTLYVKGNDYAEEDWVLVNVNDAKDVSIIRTTNKAAQKSDLVEIVAKAESFEGAQTSIWSKSYKHTIDGKDYDDAVKFYLDDAKSTGTANYTWFLDQFGNLIGSKQIANDNYAVLKDIIWKTGVGAHAEGTLVYMDGTEKTGVEIASIDGLNEIVKGEFSGNFKKSYNNAVTAQTYTEVEFNDAPSATVNVSTSDKYNDAFMGMALYLVETDKDGVVSLQGIDVKNNEIKEQYVAYENGATINAKSNILTVDDHKYALNSNTKFLVRELNEKDEYVYKTYSLKDLPAYKDGSAEIYYTVGANDFVTNVYVKTAVDAASMSKYIFVPNAATSNVEWVVKDQEYKVKVFINGEAQTVLASKKIVATLAQNEGKLFAAEWYDDSDDNHTSSSENIYGSLKSVDLVNEYTDGEFSAQATTVDYVTGKKLVKNTLTTYNNYTNGKVENNWELDGATIINADGKKVDIADLATEDGIWVVSEKTDYSSVALYVYVGTALRNNTELTASYKTDAAGAKDVNLTFEDGKAEAALTGTDKLASLTYAAEDHNAYVETPSQNEWLVVKNDDASKVYLKGVDEDVIYQVGKYTVTSAAESFNQTITVTAEDGVTTETYTIKVTNTAHSCANVAVKEGLKFGLAWGGENNADLVLNLNGNKTLTGADLKAAIYVPCTVDTGKVCEGATIVIYDTMKDADHILKDGQDLVAMKGASDLFAVVTAANGQTWSFNITIAD